MMMRHKNSMREIKDVVEQRTRMTSTRSVQEDGMETLRRAFALAREDIESARDARGTTYFDEDYDEAKKALGVCEKAWVNALAKEKSDGERDALRRAFGLKMEQLRGEFSLLREE